jgi:hypothetical protein
VAKVDTERAPADRHRGTDDNRRALAASVTFFGRAGFVALDQMRTVDVERVVKSLGPLEAGAIRIGAGAPSGHVCRVGGWRPNDGRTCGGDTPVVRGGIYACRNEGRSRIARMTGGRLPHHPSLAALVGWVVENDGRRQRRRAPPQGNRRKLSRDIKGLTQFLGGSVVARSQPLECQQDRGSNSRARRRVR